MLWILHSSSTDGGYLMGFKPKQKNFTFSDFENSLRDKKNRSLKTLMNLDNTIAWDKIESILLKDYPVADKKEGNKAYSPLLLFKCLFASIDKPTPKPVDDIHNINYLSSPLSSIDLRYEKDDFFFPSKEFLTKNRIRRCVK